MATLAHLITKFGIDAGEFNRGIQSMMQKVTGLGSSIREFGKSVLSESLVEIGSSQVLGGISRITTGVRDFISSGLDMNNAMEQARAKINAFTKDGALTANILDMVAQRASKTPFAFQEMVDAAAALGPASKQSGVALETLIAQAEVLAASNPGQGLEGAVFSLREALSGDFLSIVERFNLPKQRLQELKKAGVPALEAISTAMKEMGLDADLVSQMGVTATGRWSTLQDTFTTLAASLTRPIFDTAASSMGVMQAAIDQNMPALQELVKLVGTGLSTAMNFFSTSILPNFIAKMVGVPEIISGLVEPLRAAIEAWKTWSAFGTEFGVQAVLQSIGDSIPALEGVTTWLSDRVPAAFELARSSLETLRVKWGEFKLIAAGAFDLAKESIGAFITDVQTLVAIFQEGGLSAVFATLLSEVTELIPGLAPLTEWLSVALPTAFEVAQGWILSIVTRFQEWWTQIGGVKGILGELDTAIRVVGDAISVVTGFFNDHVVAQAALVGILTAMAVRYAALTLVQGFHTTALLLTTGVTKGYTIAQTLLNAVLAANPIGIVVLALAAIAGALIYAYNNSETFRAEIDRLWANFLRGIDVITEWANGVRERWNSTLDDLKSSWQTAANAISTTWETIKTAFSVALDIIKSTVSTKIDEVIAFFTALPGRVVDTLGNLGSTLLQAGIDLVQGFIDGILSIDVGAALVGIATGAVNAAKDAILSRSPSKLTQRELGEPMAEGIIVGLEEKMPLLKKRFLGKIDDLAPDVPKKAVMLGKEVGKALGDGMIETTGEKLKLVKSVLIRDLGDPGAIAEATEKARNLGAEVKKAIVRGFDEQSQEFLENAINLGDPSLLETAAEKGKEVGKAYADAMKDSLRKNLLGAGFLPTGAPFGSGDPQPGVAQVVMPSSDLGQQSASAFSDTMVRTLHTTEPLRIEAMSETLRLLTDESITPWTAKVGERLELQAGWWMMQIAEGISGNHSAIDAMYGMGQALATALSAGWAGGPNLAIPNPGANGSTSASLARVPEPGGAQYHIEHIDLRGTPYSLDEVEARFESAIHRVSGEASDDAVQNLRRRGVNV